MFAARWHISKAQTMLGQGFAPCRFLEIFIAQKIQILGIAPKKGNSSQQFTHYFIFSAAATLTQWQFRNQPRTNTLTN